MLDWIVRNATVVDGSGGEPFQGHVGIAGDRLAGPFRGQPPPPAARRRAGPGRPAADRGDGLEARAPDAAERRVLELEEEAAREGIAVTFDMFP